MEPSAVRAALAAAVRANAVLDGRPLAAVVRLPDSVDPPVFVAGEVEVAYDQVAEGGYDEFIVTGHVYTSIVDDAAGQRLLDACLAPRGPGSVKAAIEKDRTLGGIATTLTVERARGYGKYQISGVEALYYGAKLTIRVWGT